MSWRERADLLGISKVIEGREGARRQVYGDEGKYVKRKCDVLSRARIGNPCQRGLECDAVRIRPV